MNAETSQEGKRKLKLLLLPRPGDFVDWGTGLLLVAGGFVVGLGGLTFATIFLGFLGFPSIFRMFSCSCSATPVSTGLLKNGGTAT